MSCTSFISIFLLLYYVFCKSLSFFSKCLDNLYFINTGSPIHSRHLLHFYYFEINDFLLLGAPHEISRKQNFIHHLYVEITLIIKIINGQKLQLHSLVCIYLPCTALFQKNMLLDLVLKVRLNQCLFCTMAKILAGG